MKAMFRNYFKQGKCYQWDENKENWVITNTKIQDEFCLEKTEMEKLLKFENPTIKLDKFLTVKSGKLKAVIQLSDTKLSLPDLNFTKTFKINVDKLKIASKFTSKTNTIRPTITGINVKDNYINATDSYVAYRNKIENNCNLIITNSFVKLLANLSGELELKCNDNIIACENEGVLYIGRLISGNYPPIETIYNYNFNKYVTIDRKELKELLTYASSENDVVGFSNNKIYITKLCSEENVDFEADIDLSINETIWLNYKYLLMIVESIKEEKINISYMSAERPLLINEEFIILPLKK